MPFLPGSSLPTSWYGSSLSPATHSIISESPARWNCQLAFLHSPAEVDVSRAQTPWWLPTVTALGFALAPEVCVWMWCKINRNVPRVYRLKKMACNCTPSKIQTVPKNSNSELCLQWTLEPSQLKLLILLGIQEYNIRVTCHLLQFISLECTKDNILTYMWCTKLQMGYPDPKVNPNPRETTKRHAYQCKGLSANTEEGRKVWWWTSQQYCHQ